MPAKKFIEDFPFDPSTFNYDEFKKKVIAEIDGDTDLSTAALTTATTERDTLKANEVTLKARLFDATIGKAGDPVRPSDSPAAPGHTSAPSGVKDSDIFEKVQ